MWTVAGRLNWRLRERCRGEVGHESLLKSQGIRGGSVATPPHPQSRVGTYASTLIPQEGPESQESPHSGEEGPCDQGQRVFLTKGDQRPPPQNPRMTLVTTSQTLLPSQKLKVSMPAPYQEGEAKKKGG